MNSFRDVCDTMENISQKEILQHRCLKCDNTQELLVDRFEVVELSREMPKISRTLIKQYRGTRKQVVTGAFIGKVDCPCVYE